jgi:hypothetical protein
MKKIFVLALAGLGVVEAQEDNWSLNHKFSLSGDYVTYRRMEAHKKRFIIDESDGTLDCCGVPHFPSCTARSLVKNFRFEPGWKVGAAYLTRRSMWEMTYLWIRPWEGECKRHATGSLFFSEKHPDWIGDFNGADRAKATYKSQFQTGELNYIHYTGPRHGDFFVGSWLIGLRYCYIPESLHISYTKDGNESHYKVRTMNNLYGIQIGGGLQWNPMDYFWWDFDVKLGVAFDPAKQHTFVTDGNDTVVLRNYKALKNSYPFFTEANLRASYQLFSWMNIHASYGMIYYTGIASAPDQVSKNPNRGRHINTIGEALLYGFMGGLTLSF